MSRKNIFIIGIILIFSGQLFAQTGTLRGKVFDKNTGETLIGATVMLPGTTIGVSTDFDGNYNLTLPVGKHEISYSYISYEKKNISDIIIKDGEVTLQNVSLGEATLDIEAVVVTAKATQRTENALQVLQRKAPKVMDGISSEQISKLGDSDAGQALKRVTGVSVQDGKYVFVRGLSERYTKVTFNGAEIPALDPEKNTVQLDIFPSNIIENIVVNKTFTPDMPGESTGGQVDIVTKDFPEKFTFQFSTSFSYNPQANLNDDFLTYDGGSTDWLGMDDGTRGIPDAAQAALDKMISEGSNQINQVYFTTEELNDISKSFSTNMQPKKKKSFLNHSEKLSLGDQTSLFGKTVGYNFALSYEKSFESYIDGRLGEYNDNSGAPNKDIADSRSQENTKVAALANINFKLNNNNKVGFRYFHNQSGKNTAQYRDGYFAYENSYDQDRILAYVERVFDNFQLHGKHVIPALNNASLNWQSSYTLMKQDEPDLRFFENLYDINGTDTTFRTKTNNKPARYYRTMDEVNFSNKIDLEIPTNIFTKKSKIKLGGSYDYKSRNLDDIKFNVFSSSTNLPNGNVDYYLETEIISASNPYGYYYTSDHYQNLNNSQEAYLSVIAGYGMIDIPIGDKFRLVTGARVESSELHTEDKLPSDHSLKDDGTTNFFDILPSLNLTYTLIENMNLRFAYSRTIARPNFKEIGPSYYDFKTSEKVTGNPGLQRSVIDNIDLRWEYFFNRGEKIAISGFYKHFTDPIEKILAIEVSNREFNILNSDEINLYGAELEFRKKLDFISFLKDFTLGGNFTYIKSIYKLPQEEIDYINLQDIDRSETRPMQGQAPYIINAYLGYTNDKSKIDANLAYNVSGEKIYLLTVNSTPYAYEQPEHSLNFNISKGIGEKFNVEFSVKNILDAEYSVTQDFVNSTEYYKNYSKGRSFGLSIKYLIK